MSAHNERRKHGPNRLDRYLEIHSTAMARHLNEGFVTHDGLELSDLGDGFLSIAGSVGCTGALYMSVEKRLQWRRDDDDVLWVQTVQYAYNAIVGSVGSCFRYNSPHLHRPIHHVHRYDVLSGDKEGIVEEIVDGRWPTLSEAILEFRDWYHDNLDALASRGLL